MSGKNVQRQERTGFGVRLTDHMVGTRSPHIARDFSPCFVPLLFDRDVLDLRYHCCSISTDGDVATGPRPDHDASCWFQDLRCITSADISPRCKLAHLPFDRPQIHKYTKTSPSPSLRTLLGILIVNMASYISSYFGSGTSQSSAPQHGQYQPQYQQYQQTPAQAPSGSTWTNTFSSRIGALRKALTKDSEEDDPDNEDCSHVSNVLRAYYTEKGRPFPEWLPPDPKRPAAMPAQQSQFGQHGNTYGNNGGMPHNRGSSGGRGGLSDLWDSGPALPAVPQAQSLRASRPTAQALKSFDSMGRRSGSDSSQSQARPLPSQRAGSYQNIQPTPTPPSSGNPRDRLRARLQGSSSGRSSPANPGQAGSDRPYSGGGGGGPNLSASQPWANDGNAFASSGGPGYGNTAYQQRSGNYR